MKPQILPLIVLSALCILTPQLNAQSFVTNGLVAYYPFNGNANDASGNGNDGTVYGAALATDRFGNPGDAYSFDGTDNEIDVPDTSGFEQGSLSVSLWINAKVFSHNGIRSDIIDKGASYQWTLQLEQSGQIRNAIFTTSGQYTFDSVRLISTNAWNHLVRVWDGTNSSTYINGSFDSSIVTSGTMLQGSDPLKIGGEQSFSGNYFSGIIDDVRIYNRALSGSEVAQLYGLEAFCSPHSAQATAVLSGNGVSGAVLTDSGCGYSNTPSVQIVGGGGTGATALADMTNGIVTDLIIISAGNGYTNAPKIYIESPPYTPTVSITISAVKVAQHVRVNHNYVLQSSADLSTWTAVGPSFTATSEYLTNEFEIGDYGRFFRLQEVP